MKKIILFALVILASGCGSGKQASGVMDNSAAELISSLTLILKTVATLQENLPFLKIKTANSSNADKALAFM